MNNLTTTINGTEYPLATTMRVAFAVQEQNKHAPYMEVFSRIDKMTLDDQINIIYAAFSIANKEEAKTITKQVFFNYYLDNFTLKETMQQLTDIISAVAGVNAEDVASKTPTGVAASGNE
jgi:hypothetical protein